MESIAVKERPKNFKGEEVRAIFDNRKTQFREVIKPQPHESLSFVRMMFDWHGKAQAEFETPPGISGLMYHPLCPYGQVGDHLWVKEPWGYHGESYSSDSHAVHISYLSDGQKQDIEMDIYCPHCKQKTGQLQTPRQNLRYPDHYDMLEDDDYEKVHIRHDLLNKWWASKKKIPSIHMPQWASRLTLEITEIRVERLQEISVDDIQLEGLTRHILPIREGECAKDIEFGELLAEWDIRIRFAQLWDSINKRRVDIRTNLKTVYPHSWFANPWVWVITSSRL